MKLSSESKQQLILALLGQEEDPKPVGDSVLQRFLKIGKTYHIRTVTMDYAGTLKDFDQQHIVLTEASWVADSGRFNEYLRDTSKINENEPYKNDVIVNVGSISDITEIDNPCREVK